MSTSTVLNAETRETRPRSLRKALRDKNQVLGILQGKDLEKNIPIYLDGSELEKKIKENGKNAVFTLALAGKKIPVLLFEEQKSTFTKKWLHVEFEAVDLNVKKELEAEIKIIGVPIGVKEGGGALRQDLYSVIVSAVPDKIPEVVEVDVTNLAVGKAITIADLPPHPDFEVVGDPGEQIVIVE